MTTVRFDTFLPIPVIESEGAPFTFPKCEVCGANSKTQSQSILHPDPRLLCWPCAEAEVEACGEALKTRTVAEIMA